MPTHYDVCVIGGGIAGLSAAARLAASMRVALLEREPHLAYHSTGRSAALFAESYGNAPVRALTRASRDFYLREREGGALTVERGAMFVAGARELEAMDALEHDLRGSTPGLRRLEPHEAIDRCPALRADHVTGALLDPDARDIDVAAVVDHYLRLLRARGGVVLRDAPVIALERTGPGWRVDAAATAIEAPILVDAAGAWADEVAALAGLPPLGLVPRLRTAVRVSAGEWTVEGWPCVIDAAERWYFRPDAKALMLSPADETPCIPCDAQPDEETVAEAIARVEAVTRLAVRRPIGTWAGLRTFAPDRTPVVGFDPGAPGFFWLAGQGGYGIQTAPAIAELAAAMIEGRATPATLGDCGVDPRDLDPRRLRR